MIPKLLLLLSASLTCEAITDATGCPDTFKAQCKCGMFFSRYDSYKEKKFTVNCTNAGFKHTDMLLDVPSMTQVLIFIGNNLPSLPANLLDDRPFDRLETIDMSNNNIRFIMGKTFHKVSSVKTLCLNHNDLDITEENIRPRIFSNFENLESLHMTNAFTERVNASDYLLNLEDIFFESDLRKLKVLHLEQNEIWSIEGEEKVFCNVPELEQIHLGDNRLTDFDFVIDCLPNLRYIDLERNMISRLSKSAITRLEAYMQKKDKTSLLLNLDQNPFDCDCRAKSFFQWLNTTKLEVKQWRDYDCIDGYPQVNVGKTFGEVDDLCPRGTSSSGMVNYDRKSTSSSSSNTVIDNVKETRSYHDESNHRHGYSSATIGVLSFLLVFTSSLLLAVAYFHRNSMKNLLLPYWDFLTRKIGYTGIAPEEAPQEVNV